MSVSKDIAIEIQIKFAFYMVALVFTVLALAIETAEFGGSRIPDAFELVSWFLLLISGLSALKRIEMMPKVHIIGGMFVSSEEKEQLKQETVDARQKTMLRYYKVHIWFFVLGLIALIISRGYFGFFNLLNCNNI